MLQHVSMEVRPADVEACLAFWALLGFMRVPPPGTLAERSTWVQHGRTQIHLLHADTPVVPPEGHCAVVVEDYDATCAALREAGFHPEPRPQHWGSPRAFVRDPVGHRVEVMARPPA
jgi:catechol 2,3-dioxygenase-like lactoylglutathione lyase family enzyme